MLYDLLTFYRDNLVANSGTVGDWIDLALIPAELGALLPERLMKWISYKKLGLGLLDSSLEGRIASGQAPLNTIFNGYDDTVKVQAVLAIQVAIESIELTVSSITGVFRERLNGIELRDAVTNIKIGLNNSFIITKLYYHLMDLIINEMLLDCLNEAKIVYKDGLTGTIILGEKYQKVFTALPEHFTLTDFDIRILTSSDFVKDLELIKSIIPLFVQVGGLPPDIIIEAVTCKNIPDLKYKVKKALDILKKENNKVMLLNKLVEDLLKQLLQSTSLLEKANNKIQELNLAKLKLEQQDIKMKYEVEWYKAHTEREYREATAEELKKRTLIEIKLMYDNNPYNDQIRNI